MISDDATRLFNGVKRELDGIMAEISQHGNFKSELGDNTRNLTRNYTMENEREGSHEFITTVPN